MWKKAIVIYGIATTGYSEVVWKENFENSTFKVQGTNGLEIKSSDIPAGATNMSGKAGLLSVSSDSKFASICPPGKDPINLGVLRNGDSYKLSFNLYIPNDLTLPIGDIDFRWNSVPDESKKITTLAEKNAGNYEIVYSGTFTDESGYPTNCVPFIGVDQNKDAATDYAYIDNLKLEITRVPTPEDERDAWFKNLGKNRVNSDPRYLWRQFGPGMSGNNYRVYWHPTDPDVVFLGPNMGNAYRSVDRGTTYEPILDADGDGFSFALRGPSELGSPDFSRQNPDFGLCTTEKEAKLYRTYDRGKTWEYMDLHSVWGSQQIASLTVDPQNDNVWFASSGDSMDLNAFYYDQANLHGISESDAKEKKLKAIIWKSTDKGESWRVVTPSGINEKARIVRIIVHPKNSSIVFAATTYGLYKSTDGGESWTAKVGTGLDNNVIRSMDIHHDKTTDKITLFALDLVSWAKPENSNTVVDAGGGMFRSDDEGESWVKINGDSAVDISKLCTDVYFRNSYSKAISKWFGIKEGEVDMTNLPTALTPSFTYICVDPNDKNKIFVTNDYKQHGGNRTFYGGMLWRTDDGGEHWVATLRNGTAWEGKHKAYWQSRGNPTEDNMFLRGQKKWEKRDPYERKAGAAIAFNADSSVIMFQWAKTLVLSLDGGKTWFENDEIEVTPNSENWVAAGNSNLPGHGLIQDPRMPNDIFCPAGENDFWRVKSGGDSIRSSWQAAQRYQLGPHEYSCSSIAIHPNDTNTMYSLQFRQASAGQVLKSTDGGLTFYEWNDYLKSAPETWAMPWPSKNADGDMIDANGARVTTNDSIDQMCFVINQKEPENMFFCTPRDAAVHGYVYDGKLSPTVGVRRSTDGGKTWNWANVGLPSYAYNVKQDGGGSKTYETVDVIGLHIDPRDGTTLYASVYCPTGMKTTDGESAKGGLYVSTDNAATWTKHATLPENITSVSDVHFSTDGKIYVSCGDQRADNSANGGVWVTEDEVTWTQIFKTPWARMTKAAVYDPNVLLVQYNSAKGNVAMKNPGTYLSKDGGMTWSRINLGNPQSDRGNEIAIDQVVPDRFYISTQGCGWLRCDLMPEGNVAPEFASQADTEMTPDSTISKSVTATDANGDSLSYQKILGPDWISVDSTGNLTANPPADVEGSFICQIQADDNNGESTRETVKFIVSKKPIADFDSWMSGLNQDSAETGKFDDPDGDGIPNIEEFAFGGNPFEADRTILPTIAHQDGKIVFIHNIRNDSNVSCMIETSTNLVEGAWEVFTSDAEVSELDGSFNSVTNSIESDEPTQFFRIKIITE